MIAAIIPVKDNLPLTADLVADLRRQQLPADLGRLQILIMDNGSGPETAAWLQSQPDLICLPMPGAGIHVMWNRGLQQFPKAWPVLLNNDVRLLDDRCIARLVEPLDYRTYPALSANYDRRPGSGVQPVRTLCRGRYDGTGGFAGFAFALSRDWLDRTCYRFPEQCRWWYGDDHLVDAVHASGCRAGIALGAHCLHVGGGGQTGRWREPGMRPQLDADRAAYLATKAPR